MSYTMQLLLLNWSLFIPFLLIFVPLLVVECLKRERENVGQSGLLKTGLLLIPLTLVGMVLFIAAGIAAYRLHSQLLMILVQTVVVGLSALAEYRLAGRFALTKKKRILAALLMLLLYLAETALSISIGSGMTT